MYLTIVIVGDNMPQWINGEEVSEEDVQKCINTIVNDACLKCGSHSADCPLSKAVGEIKTITGV